MISLKNPVRMLILAVGVGLSRIGLVERDRVQPIVDLAWPRIVTGLARMSKSAVDVAMVGVGIGSAAIAGVGFASPFWGLAFTIGGGVGAGTIALVSQRFGAEAYLRMGQAVRSSVVLVILLTLPIVAVFWLFPEYLIGLLSNDPEATRLGSAYLRVLAFGIPFAGVNLIGGRILIGADDAWSPMVIRAGGAVTNVVLNAVFIFGLQFGVVGAALGTVLSNVFVTVTFVIGLINGRLPWIGSFPIYVDPDRTYFEQETIGDLLGIGLPVIGRNMVRSVARFPMLAIVGLFGPSVVAAYVISRRIWGLLNTPGWGFGLAASSLVGQALGDGDERTAEAYGWEIMHFSVATYVLAAVLVFVFADPIVAAFVGDGNETTVSVAVPLVYAACAAIVAQGINRSIAGALDATGDTRWPFYGRVLGIFGIAIPVTYLGATTTLGIVGLYLAYFAESVVPAAINYYRFQTGKWRSISRGYRPASVSDGD